MEPYISAKAKDILPARRPIRSCDLNDNLEEHKSAPMDRDMAHQQEATFKNFTPTQANAYSRDRGSYPQALYDIIYDFHSTTSPGGAHGTVIDVGCGPGISTWPLAQKFGQVIGVDPSDGMVETANSILSQRESEMGEKTIKFVAGRAEDLGGAQSADMITAATAVSSLLFWTLPLYPSRLWSEQNALRFPADTT